MWCLSVPFIASHVQLLVQARITYTKALDIWYTVYGFLFCDAPVSYLTVFLHIWAILIHLALGGRTEQWPRLTKGDQGWHRLLWKLIDSPLVTIWFCVTFSLGILLLCNKDPALRSECLGFFQFIKTSKAAGRFGRQLFIETRILTVEHLSGSHLLHWINKLTINNAQFIIANNQGFKCVFTHLYLFYKCVFRLWRTVPQSAINSFLALWECLSLKCSLQVTVYTVLSQYAE